MWNPLIVSLLLASLLGCVQAPDSTSDEVEESITVESETPTSNDLNDITFGEQSFVAVGDSGTIIRSVDGDSWNLVKTDITETLFQIAHTDGQFLAFGQGNSIFISPDGIEWSRVETTITEPVDSLHAINDQFVLMGGNGAFMISDDGSEWRSIETGVVAQLYDITYGNGVYLLVGFGNTLLSSPDLSTWTRVTPDISGSIPLRVRSITRGSSQFVSVSASQTSGIAAMSLDGILWETTQIEEFASMAINEVEHGDGTFVTMARGLCLTPTQALSNSSDTPCLSRGVVASTSDAESWVVKELTDRSLNGIAFGKQHFVVVGNGGFIATSGAGNEGRGGLSWTSNEERSVDER